MKHQNRQGKETKGKSSSLPVSGYWTPDLLKWDEALPDEWNPSCNLEEFEITPFDSSLLKWDSSLQMGEPLPEEWEVILDEWEPLPDNWVDEAPRIE